MTLRARTEPGVNAWLGKLLGDPAALFCRVAHLDSDGNELGNAEVSVEQLAIQPIDLLYIAGNELNTGTGQANEENRTSVSELELRVARFYRALKGLDDGPMVRIDFLKPDDKQSLGQLLPLLRMLKGLLTDARPLHAKDFDPPSKPGPADKSNPEGYDLAELLAKITGLQISFQNVLADIYGIAIDAVVKDTDGNEEHYFSLQAAFAALAVAKLMFADIPFSLATADATSLQDRLLAAAGTGLRDAFPRVVSAATQENRAVLLDQAMRAARIMADAADRAGKFIADAAAATETAKKIELLISTGKALLGDEFNVLPHFTYDNGSDIQLSNADRSQLLDYARNHLQMPYPAEEWLESVAHVRPRTARWDYILALYESFHGDRLSLKPIQLPYRANDSWLAVEFPAVDPVHADQPFNIVHDTPSVTFHGDTAFSTAAQQCGMLGDDWTEVIPRKKEISGIAFNYDQPNAMPPQVLLLAVTPHKKGHWTWDDLVWILDDTLRRAKLRAVEPQLLDELDRAEIGVLLPAILADFAQRDLNVALDYRMNLQYVAAKAPIEAVARRDIR